jgi:hypothetical protein
LAVPLAGQPHEPPGFPHWLQPPEEAEAGAGGGHPHGLAFLQRSQSPLEKCSLFFMKKRTKP